MQRARRFSRRTLARACRQNELTRAHYLCPEGLKLMEDKQPCRPEQASRALFAREAGEKGRRRRRRRDSAGRRNILSAARLDARGIYRTYPARILRAIFFSPNFEKSSNRSATKYLFSFAQPLDKLETRYGRRRRRRETKREND